MSLLKNQLKCVVNVETCLAHLRYKRWPAHNSSFSKSQKIKELVYCPSKCSLKNHDLGSLCKKWGLRVSHVEKSSVFALKKTFSATTLVVAFFSGNSKGIIYTHSLITFSSSISPSRLLLVSICSSGRQAGFHLTHNPKNIDEHNKKTSS